jgi:hypothetical protein
MAAQCPQCNATVSDDDAVCSNCGFRLKPLEQPTKTNEVKITIPPWATVEWGDPAFAALLVVLIGVVLQYVVGLLLLIGALIADPHHIDAAGIARVPPAVWLGFNLGLSHFAVIFTGIIWLRISARRAARLLGPKIVVDRSKVVERAVKFAVIYALIDLGIAITLRNTPRGFGDVSPTPFSLGGGPGVDPVGAFFFGLIIGFMVGVYLHTVCAGKRVRDVWPVRFDMQIPDAARSAWAGAVTALKVAIPAMAIFLFVAFILTVFTHGGGQSGAALIPVELASMILWAGIDTGFLGLIAGMQLFLKSTGIGFLFFAFGEQSWIYAGIAIPVIAMFLAGRRVGRDASLADPIDAAKRGALVGIPVGLVCFLFAILNSSDRGGGYVVRALFVPFLWGLVSAAGAYFEASQRAQQQPAAH